MSMVWTILINERLHIPDGLNLSSRWSRLIKTRALGKSATNGIEMEIVMNKYLIERQIPGAGKMSLEEIRTVARKSVNVLAGLGVEIQWVESYVSGDKIYCVYLAANEELIREHSRLTGIPVNSISEVFRVIDPTVATLADSSADRF